MHLKRFSFQRTESKDADDVNHSKICSSTSSNLEACQAGVRSTKHFTFTRSADYIIFIVKWETQPLALIGGTAMQKSGDNQRLATWGMYKMWSLYRASPRMRAKHPMNFRYPTRHTQKQVFSNNLSVPHLRATNWITTSLMVYSEAEIHTYMELMLLNVPSWR